jgi:O-Antigen ligase.
MLALILVIGLYCLLHFKSRRAVLGGMVLAVILVALVLKFGPSRLGDMSASEDSAHGRIEAWYEGTRMLMANPLFGVGYNMFGDYHFRTAHNSMILCVSETGLVGYFFWVGLFYFGFKQLRGIKSGQDGGVGGYARAMQVSMAGFIAAAFFLSRTYIILPYMLIALSTALVNIGRAGAPQPVAGAGIRPYDLKNIGIIVMISLFVAYGLIKVSL